MDGSVFVVKTYSLLEPTALIEIDARYERLSQGVRGVTPVQQTVGWLIVKRRSCLESRPSRVELWPGG